MAVGIPFVFAELAQSMPLLRKVGAMIVKEPVTARRVAGSITSLLGSSERQMRISRRGRFLVQQQFNWTREQQKLLGIYNSL